MADVPEIPICPTGFACVLLESGWKWGHDLLGQTVAWFRDQDIYDETSLIGLDIGDLINIGQWPQEASEISLLHHATPHRLRLLPGTNFHKAVFAGNDSTCIPCCQCSRECNCAQANKRRRMAPGLRRATSENTFSVIKIASELHAKPTQVLPVKGARPLQALQILAQRMQGDPAKQAQWREEARVAAVMGSCPRSKDSFRSGAPCY